jgi:hypothetical protein
MSAPRWDGHCLAQCTIYNTASTATNYSMTKRKDYLIIPKWNVICGS